MKRERYMEGKKMW